MKTTLVDLLKLDFGAFKARYIAYVKIAIKFTERW
jgi:hypothetical protein